MKRLILLLWVVLLAGQNLGAQQKHIVVLGSSTAAGTGPSSLDSAWVWRLRAYFNKNTTPGNPDTLVTNLAVGGFTTYKVMPAPSGTYTTPPGKPLPDPAHNVTFALSLNPDIIIINLPSNDTDWGFSKKETMDNFRLLFSEITAAGKRAYITTTQPRNFANTAQRDSLRTLVDSINNNFGMYAIDFWSDLVNNDGSNTLLPAVNVDGIHVNDLGHRLLFQKVLLEDLFPASAPLPVQLTQFSGRQQGNKVLLQWETSAEDMPVIYEIQKSRNAHDFSTIGMVQGKQQAGNNSYSWTGDLQEAGTFFYRLLVREGNRTSYSPVVKIIYNQGPIAVEQVFLDGNFLQVELTSAVATRLSIDIYSPAGALVKNKVFLLDRSSQQLQVDLSSLPAAQYLVSITTASGYRYSGKIIRR